MTKVYLTLIAILTVAILGVGYMLDNERTTNAELVQKNKSLTEATARAVERSKLDRKVLVAKEAKIATQARIMAMAQEALSEALQRNKSWSDTDVPDDVQKALVGRSDGPPRVLSDP